MIPSALARMLRAAVWRLSAGVVFAVLMTWGMAASYVSPDELRARLASLSEAHPNLLKFESLTKTSSGKDIWLATLDFGASGVSNAPAILAVAGLEGNDLAGSVVLLSWLESLATNHQAFTSAAPARIYVVPCANPDAAAARWEKPVREVAGDSTPVDEDHDELMDEDGPDDLNGDGLITWMRIRDPDGEYISDPKEPRLMVKADRSKGEAGAWRLHPEGRDNDGDENWNEDPPGGVNLNRNFPYNYKYFGPDSGSHPMSQAVTRALADFVIAHPSIGIVFAFGAGDNLARTPKAEAPKRPPVALHESDLPIYRELGKTWRETLGLKKELEPAQEPGTFADWMYFHRGRLALATKAWSPALQVELSKSSGTKTNEPASPSQKEASPSPAKPGPKPSAEADAARNEEPRAFLRWLETNAPTTFVPWKSVDHPDFPGKEVEVGGFAPFAQSNPPESLLDELAAKHVAFLNSLPAKLPRVEIRKQTVKHLGNSVFDITVDVANRGYLPTALTQGELTREVYPTRVILDVPEKAILSGTRRVTLDTLPGSGGMEQVRWILNGNGLSKAKVEVTSTLGGSAEVTLDLNPESK